MKTTEIFLKNLNKKESEKEDTKTAEQSTKE